MPKTCFEEEKLAYMRESQVADLNYCDKFKDDYGIERYRGNKIVQMLLEFCDSIDMNRIATLTYQGCFSEKERKEFYKMIGYSIDGYHEIFGEEDDEI